MQFEQITIYDENLVNIGSSDRNNVHRLGFWHKTFHLWFVYTEEDINYLIFQRRSPNVRALPNKLDASTAGHSIASDNNIIETVKRETLEEVGYSINTNELIPLGIRTINIREADFLNREYQYIYLYQFKQNLQSFKLDMTEVTSLVLVEIDKGLDFFTKNLKSISAINISKNNERTKIQLQASDFYPSIDN